MTTYNRNDDVTGRNIFDIGTDAFSGSPSGTTSQKPKTTLMNAVGCQFKPVSAAGMQSLKVKSDMSNSGTVAKQNQGAAAGLKQEANQALCQLTDSVQKLKADVCATAEAAGFKPGETYADERMGNMGPLELVGPAMVCGASVQVASLVKATNIGATLDFIHSKKNSKGSKGKEAQQAEVDQFAASQAAAPKQDTRESEQPSATAQSISNVGNAVAAGYGTADIMSITPENIESVLPEARLAAQVRDDATELGAGLEGVQQEAAKMDPGHVCLIGECVAGVSALQANYSPDNTLRPEIKAQMVAANEENLINQAEKIAQNVYAREFSQPAMA